MSVFKPMRGEAVLEVMVTAVNELDGRFRRSDMFLTLGGKRLSLSVTDEQKIWNALPRAVRDAIIEEGAEAAEPDDSDADEHEQLGVGA